MKLGAGPSRTAPRRLDRRERLPGGWNAESGSPVAGSSIVAARRLECRERLPGDWTVENSSPEARPSRAAPRWLDRPWWLPGGWNAESGSPVAGPSIVAARRLECRERLPGAWTVHGGCPEAGMPRATPRWLSRREQLPGCWTDSGSPEAKTLLNQWTISRYASTSKTVDSGRTTSFPSSATARQPEVLDMLLQRVYCMYRGSDNGKLKEESEDCQDPGVVPVRCSCVRSKT